MKECDNSTRKKHKQQLHIVHKSSNNVWHLITKTITTPQHSATLHHTSSNYTSLHFTTLHHTSPNYISLHISTLHFLSFTLHYPFIYLYAFTFPIVLVHFTSHHVTSTDLIPKIISKKVNHFTAQKNFSPFHFTSLHFTFYFILFIYLFICLLILSTLHFTLLCYS